VLFEAMNPPGKYSREENRGRGKLLGSLNLKIYNPPKFQNAGYFSVRKSGWFWSVNLK
jgi:hypothetical protein